MFLQGCLKSIQEVVGSISFSSTMRKFRTSDDYPRSFFFVVWGRKTVLCLICVPNGIFVCLGSLLPVLGGVVIVNVFVGEGVCIEFKVTVFSGNDCTFYVGVFSTRISTFSLLVYSGAMSKNKKKGPLMAGLIGHMKEEIGMVT